MRPIDSHLLMSSGLEKLTRSFCYSVIHKVHLRMTPSGFALNLKLWFCSVSRGERVVLGEVQVVVVLVMGWIKNRQTGCQYTTTYKARSKTLTLRQRLRLNK